MAKYRYLKPVGQRGDSPAPATNLPGLSGMPIEAKLETGVGSTLNMKPQRRSLVWVNVGLLIWFAVVEAGVYGWYARRESQLVLGPAWTIKFPAGNPTFRELPISSDTERLLRYDEGRQAAWTEADGAHWQGFYFNWQAGRVAGYLAKRHTPEACLVASGYKLLSGPVMTMLTVHGVELPMRNYVFESGGEVVYVFQCRWEAGARDDAYANNDSLRFNLVRAIWTSRGKLGQKVLEFVVSGQANQDQARQSLLRQLDGLIQLEDNNQFRTQLQTRRE